MEWEIKSFSVRFAPGLRLLFVTPPPRDTAEASPPPAATGKSPLLVLPWGS